jgi:hypothetical protein
MWVTRPASASASALLALVALALEVLEQHYAAATATLARLVGQQLLAPTSRLAAAAVVLLEQLQVPLMLELLACLAAQREQRAQ